MLYVDGIRNVRDCGGWRAEGGFLREGILFRGSEMNLIGNHGIELTEQGRKTMCRELRIRTDIDLRNEEEAGHIAESPLGASVRYERKPVLGYMDLFKEEFNDTLREILSAPCGTEKLSRLSALLGRGRPHGDARSNPEGGFGRLV